MPKRFWIVASTASLGFVAALACSAFPMGDFGGGWGGSPLRPTAKPYTLQDQKANVALASQLQAAQTKAVKELARQNANLPKPLPQPETELDEASAIATFIAASGKLPADGKEFQAAVDNFGNFAQLPIPFSAVALDSGLSNPRIVFAATSSADPTKPNLSGRLFLAANLEPPFGGVARLRSVEFISWNSRTRKFDFGVIEDIGGEPRARMLDGVRCASCHKNRGPILGAGPWSNTAHNDVLRRATQLTFLPLTVPHTVPNDPVAGMRFLDSRAPEVDAGVRLGGSLAANRETVRLLARTPQGRKAVAILLAGIAAPGRLDRFERESAVEVNELLSKPFVKLAADWLAVQKATKSSVLVDFNPAGSTGSAALVGRYDVARIQGESGLPTSFQPSNPKAFAKPQVKAPLEATQIVSATLLARTIGLNEGDRNFLGSSLVTAARQIPSAKVTPAALARQVFEGPKFADALESGDLPEREDFKQRFVDGLDDVLQRTHGVAAGFKPNRNTYASGPVFTRPSGSDEKQVPVAPSTACLRCHEVRGTKARFPEPLPALAFDPFDKRSRDAWLKTADKARKQDVLTRMLQRLAVDKDMPPEDEPEHDLFRVNDPASFAEVKAYLETELKNMKGK